MNTDTHTTLVKLANSIPLSDEEWGTAAQINAENSFWLELEKHLSKRAYRKLEDYALKGTTQENVSYALQLLKAEDGRHIRGQSDRDEVK